MIQNYLNQNKSLPDGYTIKTKVAEGKISPVLTKCRSRKCSIKWCESLCRAEGYKAPDAIWDPNADIASTFCFY